MSQHLDKYDVLLKARECGLITVPLFLVYSGVGLSEKFKLFMSDYILADGIVKDGIKYMINENLRYYYINNKVGDFTKHISMVELTDISFILDKDLLYPFENTIRGWIFDKAISDNTDTDTSIRYKFKALYTYLVQIQEQNNTVLKLTRSNAVPIDVLRDMNKKRKITKDITSNCG